MNDKFKVIVATIAFGLGINKPNVRYVIHKNIPKALEGYIQECGWAGRDWLNSECIFIYNFKDSKEHDFFIHSYEEEDWRKHHFKQLFWVIDFAEEKYICWRKMLLDYLGENFDENECKKMCDNCCEGWKGVL